MTENAERQDGVYSRGSVKIGRGNMSRVHSDSSEYADKRWTAQAESEHGHLRQKTVADMMNKQK